MCFLKSQNHVMICSEKHSSGSHNMKGIRIEAVISVSLPGHEKQIFFFCILSKNVCNYGTPAKLQSQFSIPLCYIHFFFLFLFLVYSNLKM